MCERRVLRELKEGRDTDEKEYEKEDPENEKRRI